MLQGAPLLLTRIALLSMCQAVALENKLLVRCFQAAIGKALVRQRLIRISFAPNFLLHRMEEKFREDVESELGGECVDLIVVFERNGFRKLRAEETSYGWSETSEGGRFEQSHGTQVGCGGMAEAWAASGGGTSHGIGIFFGTRFFLYS